MTAAENDRHDRFLRLYVEHEEALRGFVRSLVPTLEDARGGRVGCGGGATGVG
ncbi:MAG: hypothetical protein RLZZ476_64 [Verrucomicrobiota bacterium]|jgi:hypothetical protein